MARSQETCLKLDLIHFADEGMGLTGFEPGRGAGFFAPGLWTSKITPHQLVLLCIVVRIVALTKLRLSGVGRNPESCALDSGFRRKGEDALSFY